MGQIDRDLLEGTLANLRNQEREFASLAHKAQGAIEVVEKLLERLNELAMTEAELVEALQGAEVTER